MVADRFLLRISEWADFESLVAVLTGGFGKDVFFLGGLLTGFLEQWAIGLKLSTSY